MKRFVLVLLLVALAIAPLSLAGAQEPGSDTFIYRSIGNVTTLNPLLTTDGGSNAVAPLLWPRPIDVDRFTGVPLPGLTTWEVSEDGLTFTFHIDEDAQWSDGTPITAADAKFTYDAPKSENVQSTRLSNVALFDSVNVIDDKTFEIKLSNVSCAIWKDIGSLLWLPAHKFAPDYSDFMDSPMNISPDISGGPYILAELRPDEFTRLTANPTFYKGEPSIANVIVKIITDDAIMVQALQAGEVDYGSMNSTVFEQIGNLDNLNYASFGQDSLGFMGMSWTDPANPMPAYDEEGNLNEQPPHPLFADVRVRQAVAMGYNKDDILTTFGEGGAARLVANVVPAMGWAFNNEIEPWPYDPEAAAALLEEAGWTDQDGDGIRECHGCLYAEEGTPLAFKISYSSIAEYFTTSAIVAQDQLGQLGFDVTIEDLEWATYLNDVLLAQKFDATIVGWGGFNPPDPTSTEPMLLSENDAFGNFNFSSYVNPELDALMEQGRTVPGCAPEDRAPIYYEIQRIVHDDVAIEFTVSANVFSVWNKRISMEPGPWWYVTDTTWEYGITG